MKKKILSVCLVAVIAVMAIAGASLAYFTDTKTEVNTFTVGNVEIELVEENWDEPQNVAPGMTYAKDPVVNNVGTNDAWIRVDVTLSDAAAFTAAAEKHNITDLATVFAIADDFDEKWVLVSEPALDEDEDTLTYSYYYLDKLASDASTDALFSSVTIPAAFDNEDMSAIGEDFTITVVAHAIQADGFATVEAAFAAYNG